MNLTKVKTGDIVLVDGDKVQGEDNSYAAYLIHPAVYPVYNEGERMVRVEPIPRWTTRRYVRVSDIIAHYPHKAGKRPGRIERLVREYDPREEVVGGITKYMEVRRRGNNETVREVK